MMRQLPLAIGLQSEPSFDNFVAGTNPDCVAYLSDAVAHLEQTVPSPTYVWGPSGSGKTHLLRSVEAAIAARGGRCGWLCAETAPVPFDPNWAALLLDHCERFDADHQEAAFRAFIEAQTYGVWMVAAGDVPPVDLSVREDLRTRLGWGVVFELEPLTEEERRAALWQEFHTRGLHLTDEVSNYILTRFSRDMSSLTRLLDRLDRYALATQRAVTVPLIRSMFEEGAGDDNAPLLPVSAQHQKEHP